MAKIKDGKGKDLSFLNKKKLQTKIPPKNVDNHIASPRLGLSLTENSGMGWKEMVTDYFSFSRKDRIAIITLILIITVVFFLPEISTRVDFSKPHKADTSWIAALKRIEIRENENERQTGKYVDENSMAYQYDRPTREYPVKTKAELFYFDPNNLSTEGWQRLGLRIKTITTIQNYLARGGKFRKPEDLQKIYGLFPDEFDRIAPYIIIDLTGEAKSNKDFIHQPLSGNASEKPYASRYTIIDINSADTTAFIALPGIGSKLAVRIVNFREKLGGFYSVAQVGETFGLPDSAFQKIKQYLKLENTSIRKININTATVDELKAHPYIKWSLANPIVAYRNEHGSFANVEDIRKVMAVTDDIFKKIEPYLIVQ